MSRQHMLIIPNTALWPTENTTVYSQHRNSQKRVPYEGLKTSANIVLSCYKHMQPIAIKLSVYFYST